MGKRCGPLVRARKRRKLVYGVREEREVGNAYRRGIVLKEGVWASGES
jgi:hypothetical protein